MRIKKTVESLVAAVTSTDVAVIERELRKLEGRRSQLVESLDAATHHAIDASTVRRELIIDNRDQQTLEEANAKVREAEERRVALVKSGCGDAKPPIPNTGPLRAKRPTIGPNPGLATIVICTLT